MRLRSSLDLIDCRHCRAFVLFLHCRSFCVSLCRRKTLGMNGSSPTKDIEAYPVSRRVNNPSNDEPGCVESVT
jgi:hypothetical protein